MKKIVEVVFQCFAFLSLISLAFLISLIKVLQVVLLFYFFKYQEGLSSGDSCFYSYFIGITVSQI